MPDSIYLVYPLDLTSTDIAVSARQSQYPCARKVRRAYWNDCSQRLPDQSARETSTNLSEPHISVIGMQNTSVLPKGQQNIVVHVHSMHQRNRSGICAFGTLIRSCVEASDAENGPQIERSTFEVQIPALSLGLVLQPACEKYVASMHTSPHTSRDSWCDQTLNKPCYY